MNRTLKSKKKVSSQELKRDHPSLLINFTGKECLVQVTSDNSAGAGHEKLVIQDANNVTLMSINSLINDVKNQSFTGFQILFEKGIKRFDINDPRFQESTEVSVFKIQGLGSNDSTPLAINPTFPLHCTVIGGSGDCDLVIIDTNLRETVVKQTIDAANEGFDLGMSGKLLGNVSNIGSTTGEINKHDVEYIDKHFGEHLGDVDE